MRARACLRSAWRGAGENGRDIVSSAITGTLIAINHFWSRSGSCGRWKLLIHFTYFIIIILIFVFALRTFSAPSHCVFVIGIALIRDGYGTAFWCGPTVGTDRRASQFMFIVKLYFPRAMRQTFNFTFTYEYTIFKASARAHCICVPTAAHKILHLMKMLPAAAAKRNGRIHFASFLFLFCFSYDYSPSNIGAVGRIVGCRYAFANSTKFRLIKL